MNYIKQVVIELLLKQLRTNIIQNKKFNNVYRIRPLYCYYTWYI